MKDIVTFLNEALEEELNEGKETLVKFKLIDCDECKNVYDDIAAEAQAKGIYFENVDKNTFRLKLKQGQDIDGILDLLQGQIDSVPEDKQEELQDKIDSLKNSISKAEEAVKEEDENKDEDDDE